MAAPSQAAGRRSRRPRRALEADRATRDPAGRVAVIGARAGFFALFLLLPLVAVFVEAFRKGVGVYLAALTEPDALAGDPADAR